MCSVLVKKEKLVIKYAELTIGISQTACWPHEGRIGSIFSEGCMDTPLGSRDRPEVSREEDGLGSSSFKLDMLCSREIYFQ